MGYLRAGAGARARMRAHTRTRVPVLIAVLVRIVPCAVLVLVVLAQSSANVQKFSRSNVPVRASAAANKRVTLPSRLASRLHMPMPQAVSANGTTGCAAIHQTIRFDGADGQGKPIARGCSGDGKPNKRP